MISNWLHLCSDKLTKEEEDIHKLRHDLRKASISNQSSRQAPEVRPYNNLAHYTSFPARTQGHAISVDDN